MCGKMFTCLKDADQMVFHFSFANKDQIRIGLYAVFARKVRG
jgi:hypothetical protein